ncbi:MAG: Na+/H+ antiporter NhaA, partial [Eggerthellaceae bacterium]|nr:Na+/H+ antiporter NhaA [Eggerthellaceae bacterium]
MLFSFVVVKLKISQLPSGVDWVHMLVAAILGGVGFTMAIFVANLAFTDLAIRTTAKAGVLTGSVLAGILGFTVLLIKTNLDARRTRS